MAVLVCLALGGCRLFQVYVPGDLLLDTASEDCQHLELDLATHCGEVGWAGTCVTECQRAQNADPELNRAWHDCWHGATPSCDAMTGCLSDAGYACGPS